MCDGVTYWQIQDKQDPKRNVWVSGEKGLCDTPERAMKLAQGCDECLEGEWDIIGHKTEESWQNARRQYPLPKRPSLLH